MRKTGKRDSIEPRKLQLNRTAAVRLAAPELEVLRVIGEESRWKGTDRLSSCQIDQVIKATRRKP